MLMKYVRMSTANTTTHFTQFTGSSVNSATNASR